MLRSWHSLNSLIGVLVNSAVIVTASADLKWEKTAIAVDAKLGDSKTLVSYPFTNESPAALTVRNLVTSCHCTVAKLDKREYQPGETGTVEVTLNHEQHTGLQKSQIIVVTDDPDHPNHELSLAVNIPEWIEISPAFVMWKVGTHNVAKEIHLKFADPNIQLEKVDGAGKDLEIQVASDKDGGKILVKPKSTDKAKRSPINIAVQLPDKSTKIFHAYAVVK